MSRKRKLFIAYCANCLKKITVKAKSNDTPSYMSLDQYRKSGRVYCSEKCLNTFKRKLLSEKMKSRHQKNKVKSDFMKINNPMFNPETRRKASETLKRKGFKPPRPKTRISRPQILLAAALGKSWKIEYILNTGVKGGGIPSNYKIDIANSLFKIAIEVDGSSHDTLKKQKEDKKKETFLKSRGWRIIRFKNNEVLEDVDDCVRKVKLCQKIEGLK